MGKRRGFTLIELLVVITIIAILVGVALPYVQNYIHESRLSKAKSDLDEIAKALMIYEVREGVYKASTLGPIIGRYLNNSPIDPWGAPYLVATASGIVFSAGPDRIPHSYDDITANYLPLLALASVKWVDANNSGAVDSQNRSDYLMLQFSRKIDPESEALVLPSAAYKYFRSTSTNTIEAAFSWSNLMLDNSGSLITLPLANGVLNAFTPGSDTLWVCDGEGLRDLASSSLNPGGNRCITSQTLVIMPFK